MVGMVVMLLTLRHVSGITFPVVFPYHPVLPIVGQKFSAKMEG